MEATFENWDCKLPNNKANIENLTPHKIAVVAFIREYGLLKIEAKKTTDCPPKYRKDFCLLALKLIQCPDMEFKELETLLTDGRYNLLNVHLQNFCVRLENIIRNGIGALMDCVTSTIDKLMIEANETSPCVITRSSVLGFYLRRIMLQLDKLTFVQLVSLYKSFCLYYQKGRPGLIMRSLSKEKLNNSMESQTSGLVVSTSVTADEPKPVELFARNNVIDKDINFEECRWSRKQAELFTAQQANLLEINEKKALPPKQLQKTITQIIKDIPDYSDIHFLSFMNCIRMKEFCGAQDSLYNCFDRTMINSTASNAGNDKNKNCRYAALNRAAMHTQFGHKSLGMESVREALVVAQEAGDCACLAQCAAWGALAGSRARRAALLARAPPAPRAAAAAALLMAQHAAVNAAPPAQVFQMITKGDAINYLHSMTDLTMAGLANTAALWAMYGKSEMASVTCQLLLNLNTRCGVWVATEAGRAGVGGAARAAAARGRGALAAALLAHLPAHVHTHHALHAHLALTSGKWEEAEKNIKRLESYDRWESQLLKAEMFMLKGNATDALKCLRDILDYCKTEDDSLHFMTYRLKSMILISQIQYSFSSIQSTNIMLLNQALSLAKRYHLLYVAATIEMHIANVQLQMGCAKNALNLVRKVLPAIMAHGSAYDMARGLLLYTKCRVATAPVGNETRTLVLQSCCESLESVKKNFSKVGAQVHLLQTWYLQAQLYNEIGNISARNQCAWMYRQLETQNTIELCNTSLIMY